MNEVAITNWLQTRLRELGAWVYSDYMALIAECERLKSRCDELTINGFSAQLKQLDSLRTENAMLKDAVAGYAGSGQRIQDLSDDVGLLEATNKDLSAEIERLREMLSDVANSGVQLEAAPPGLSYATVQIDAELWARLREEFGS